MKTIIVALFILTTGVACAQVSKKMDRATASASVSDYQTEACGSLKRVRYENHSGEVVLKLLIGSTNIKFYRDKIMGLDVNETLLASALVNKKIKVCYIPGEKQGSSSAPPTLDFYFE